MKALPFNYTLHGVNLTAVRQVCTFFKSPKPQVPSFKNQDLRYKSPLNRPAGRRVWGLKFGMVRLCSPQVWDLKKCMVLRHAQHKFYPILCITHYGEMNPEIRKKLADFILSSLAISR